MASLLELGAQIASVYRKKGPVRDANARPAQPAAPASAGSDDHSLSNLVEREIIPRLVASHPLAGKNIAAAADRAKLRQKRLTLLRRCRCRWRLITCLTMLRAF